METEYNALGGRVLQTRHLCKLKRQRIEPARLKTHMGRPRLKLGQKRGIPQGNGQVIYSNMIPDLLSCTTKLSKADSSSDTVGNQVTNAAALWYHDKKDPKLTGALNNRQSRWGIIEDVLICPCVTNRSPGGFTSRPSKTEPHSHLKIKNSSRFALAT
ncbi:hypothetical protein CRG98_046722 [Punica granatum]|uniref:Uncharacterized protein n=1 Tax=Punica granatum TaxID=22663 RepID=A0A2I0HN53_PUNGR|nr:hypothetical protein CRG98_046722 [Punica granatum]